MYNGGRFLAQAINSALAQDYRPLEIIVVDDGSTDNSAAVAQGFGDAVRYIYQENAGDGAARNTGIRAAKGSLIAFLDSDDLWPSDKLTRQVGFMEQRPELSYTVTMLRMFTEPGAAPPPTFDARVTERDMEGMIPSALVARADLFQRIGVFSTELRFSSDPDWFFRAKDAGEPMAIIPAVLLHKRLHGANWSHHVRDIRREMLQVVRASVARQRSRAESNDAE